LTALVVAAHKHLRLLPEDHTFSQSFYYAIISAITYFIISTLLLWNLLGAWAFKKYPPTFTSLTISQRTLMLQTVSYSLYIALGAGIFSSLEGWSFVDGVYWADYTLLTIGLGSDFAPKRLVSKALLIPYAVVGVIMIGLIVGSVRGLFLERGKIKVRRRALEKERRKTIKRLDRQDSETDFKHEFELMRGVQNVADRVRRWFGLGTSFTAFLIVWLGGAVAFMLSEKGQGWDYFQALYFTYTSLLTIGYGDFYPRSNFGKPFFVIWSLIAVPTVTILISNMGDTVVNWVKKGTLWLGQKTILPERKKFRGPHKVNKEIEEAKGREESRKKPSKKGIQRDVERLGNVVEESEKKAEEDPNETNKPEHHLGRKIAKEISSLAKDIGSKPPRKYEWDEWKRFLELLGQPQNQEDDKWRWLGHDGPLLSGVTETEWILAKMCERLEEVFVREKVI
jgi:potassium channel subfamily K